jgi:hypothetical protein
MFNTKYAILVYGGGGGELTREKVIGVIVHEAGLKIPT